MNISEFHKIFLSSSGISTDSRQVVSGQIYFALSGERFNGNKFADSALSQNASAVVVDDIEYYKEDDRRYYLVDDTLKFLQKLAKYHRSYLNIPVIALTGTNGKTTTKELIYRVLSTKYNVACTKGNYNNHIGVPLTILATNSDHNILVVEMGANHVGEIKFLCEIAHPDIGLITNIGNAHLEGFGSFEGVVTAKTEMYKFLKMRGGFIIYNQNDDLLMSHLDNYREAKPYISNERINLLAAYPKLAFNLDGHAYTTNIVGGFNLQNIRAALSVSILMKCNLAKCVKAICDYNPTNNRSQQIIIEDRNFILDAYNANPTSMQLSIEGFAESTFTEKHLILGDMLELGDKAINEHKTILNTIAKYEWESVTLVGEIFYNCRNEYPTYLFHSGVTGVDLDLHNFAKGSCTLIKGSRGIALEKLLDKMSS